MKFQQKVNAIYLIIRKIIKKPKSIFLILKDESEYHDYLVKKYGKTEFPTIEFNRFLIGNKSEISNYAFLEGGSWITDLSLLKSLALKYSKCDYLEIGSWRGESIVNVADVDGAECISINLSPDQIIAQGLPEKYAYEHGCFIKNRENIKTVYADSTKFDFKSLNRKFDLIFVDGDHKYKAVKSDTKNVFELLKNENSIIVWHDYGFDPVTPRHSVIAAIMDGLPEKEHKNLFHVSNTLCAVYIKDNHDFRFDKTDSSINKVFKVCIESVPFE
jgi:hypothetical protein